MFTVFYLVDKNSTKVKPMTLTQTESSSSSVDGDKVAFSKLNERITGKGYRKCE